MAEKFIHPEYQRLFGNVNALAAQRALGLTPEIFSTSDWKKVELINDPSGNRFVRRTYSQDAIRQFRFNSGVDFPDTWNAFQREFRRAGIDIVPGGIASADSTHAVVMTEYRPDIRPVYDAPVAMKASFASTLGKLWVEAQEFYPRLEMLRHDTFAIAQGKDGNDSIVLIDVDPYLISKNIFEANPKEKDRMTARYIEYISELFFDRWCQEGEEEAVMGRFVRAVSSALLGDAMHLTELAYHQAKMMRYLQSIILKRL